MDGIDRYFQPNTLDGLSIYSSILAGEPLYIDGSNAMQADADMGGHNVKNVATATANDEAVNLGQVNLALGGKADLSYVNTQLATKADTTYVNTQLATKADTTYVNTQDNLRILKAGDTMTGALAMSGNKITGLAAGSTNGDAVRYEQLVATDTNCVHLTGNETIAGVKTFTSSPVIPVQPTLMTQATSQKMMAGPRNASWVGTFATLENPAINPVFDTIQTIRQVAYSPFELGNGTIQGTAVGSSATINELWVSSHYMHAGLPVTGWIITASNNKYNLLGTDLIQYPKVMCGIWDGDTGALVAESRSLNLRISTTYIGGTGLYWANFFLPVITLNPSIVTWTPNVSKRYVFGIYWQTLTNRANNQNIVAACSTNHQAWFQKAVNGGWVSEGVKQSCGVATGVSSFPTNISGLNFYPYQTGSFCCFLTGDTSVVW